MTNQHLHTQQFQTNNPAVVLEWAKKRGVTILVNLPGSHGDHYVRADRKDFILKMSLHINPLKGINELSSTYYYEPVRKTIYSA